MSVDIKGVHFKVADFTGLVNFEWQSQNEVGNIDIFVLFKDCEKLYCMTIKWNSNQRLSYPLNFLPSFSKKKKTQLHYFVFPTATTTTAPSTYSVFFPSYDGFLIGSCTKHVHSLNVGPTQNTRQRKRWHDNTILIIKNIMSSFMLNVWRSRPHPSLIASSNVAPHNNKKRAHDNDTCDIFYL